MTDQIRGSRRPGLASTRSSGWRHCWTSSSGSALEADLQEEEEEHELTLEHTLSQGTKTRQAKAGEIAITLRDVTGMEMKSCLPDIMKMMKKKRQKKNVSSSSFSGAFCLSFASKKSCLDAGSERVTQRHARLPLD